MIIITLLETIAGSLRKTQVVAYPKSKMNPNGKKVKRIYSNPNDLIPSEIVDMAPDSPLPMDSIHNQEYMQYAHVMGL